MQKDQLINKISAFIVAYNEEKLIERCLKSLINAVDEIIVIHDGPCKDNTLAISRKYTDRVYEMPVNKGIGESHYIFAIEKCKYPWFLRIDADEYIEDKLKDNLKELTSVSDIACYYFIWPIWDGTKYISKGWPYKNFLFQKSKTGMIDLFHHPILVYGKTKKINQIIHHKPLYNNYTTETFQNKTLKWCKLQARDHLVPLETIDKYNMNLKSVENERRKKDLIYKYPSITYVMSFFTVLLELVSSPSLVIQKGFWLTVLISAKYSYNVAREVQTIKNRYGQDGKRKI